MNKINDFHIILPCYCFKNIFLQIFYSSSYQNPKLLTYQKNLSLCSFHLENRDKSTHRSNYKGFELDGFNEAKLSFSL